MTETYTPADIIWCPKCYGVCSFSSVGDELLDDRPTLIRRFVENRTFKAKLLDEAGYSFFETMIVAVNKKDFVRRGFRETIR